MDIKLITLLILLTIYIIGCNKYNNRSEYLEGTSEFLGKKIFEDMACNVCHTINGSLKLGPSLQDQYGKKILHTDGTVAVVDDKYIRESIISPLRYIVDGYTPIMPSYEPILNDEDINNLIEYIKTLK